MKGLAITDVAERTGLAAGTIRMWEQRYGFPAPERAPSGYRGYRQEDVDLLRRAVAFRARGLSVPAALDRARTLGETDRPSIYGAIVSGEVPVEAQVLRKRTLIAISQAIEDETMARGAGPVVFGAFQHVRNYRAERIATSGWPRWPTRGGVRRLPGGARRPRTGPPRSRSRPTPRSATSGR